MNVQTLLNHLTTGGFTLEQCGNDGLKVLGPVEKLSSPLKAAIREHKPTLRLLACIPLSPPIVLPRVVHIDDCPEGWQDDQRFVYIGRANPRRRLTASDWANPYRIGKDGDRAEVIASYIDYLDKTPELYARVHELYGKTLVCWCKPEECHGDVIVDIAVARLERNAIAWADTFDADAALGQALADWDDPDAHPSPCDCGSLLFRWDIQGNRHCIQCSPGQSARVAAIAKRVRKQTVDMVKSKSPEVFDHPERL